MSLTTSNTHHKLSPQLKSRFKDKAHSDSEGSLESNSQQSAGSGNAVTLKDSNKSSKRRRGSEWEILEGLREGQRYENKPQVFTGYLHKKRKWPLKGWHKRYFVIDKGILVYARGPNDITRGKIHGSVDIGLSVISTKSKSKRIDIDAEEFIYHLKAKRIENFTKWIEQLKKHRLFRQHLLTFGTRDASCNDCDTTIQNNNIPLTPPDLSPTREAMPRTILGGTASGSGRLAMWLMDSAPVIETMQKDMKQIGHNVNQLTKMLDQINTLTVPGSSEPDTTCDGLSPNVKKDRKKFGLRKKKSGKGSSISVDTAGCSPNNETLSPGLGISFTSTLSSSQTNLNCNAVGDHPQHGSASTDYQLREHFAILAKDVQESLKSNLYRLSAEWDRLKNATESESCVTLLNSSNVANLRLSLNKALLQNNDLRSRLNRVHELTDLAELSCLGLTSEAVQKTLGGSLSYSSSCLSASEFFDAEDTRTEAERKEPCAHDGSESSSEENNSLSSEDNDNDPDRDSVSSENSEVATDYAPAAVSGKLGSATGRRTKLPAPRPDSEGFSLWNILCKNIGKDLSQVSMPVALNEPLNMLQRMCEELEYSELLDKASELLDPMERMVYIAAFAVSCYGNAAYRAGSKPFNPLLGETYEAIREDKGFKFVAEQVSHHPPVSVCHAESKNFVFWQDVRIKTKFWGKSMEFQPAGTVNVNLPRFDEQYQWNKVTTCVHNLFSSQRWVDQYGELKIVSTSGIVCKLTFVKASYWSAKRHEVHGSVYSADGKAAGNMFGKWSEALYYGHAPSAKCIWRPGTMPEEYELYYGFTRFAMELNELDPDMSKYLPPTDTRFRPDQRLLEEGDLKGAEELKLALEQSQRDRRKLKGDEHEHESRWFTRAAAEPGDERWNYNYKYWDMRKNPGFVNMEFQPLW